MKISGNEPARPYTDGTTFAHDGLTIRQQFAMAAMQGIFSNAESLETHAKIANKIGVPHEVIIARCSFDMADALIEENNRREADNV